MSTPADGVKKHAAICAILCSLDLFFHSQFHFPITTLLTLFLYPRPLEPFHDQDDSPFFRLVALSRYAEQRVCPSSYGGPHGETQIGMLTLDANPIRTRSHSPFC